MSIPSTHVEVPQRVLQLAGVAALTPVWHNNIGGLTFRTDDGRFIKYGPLDLEANMRDEAERMRWASRWTRVPAVLDQGEDATHEWIVSAALPGESAVAPRWIDEPAAAVRAVGEGLRALHDALPIDECLWSWSVSDRIANAEARGIRIPPALREAPAIDRLVVCHGDACVPNTLNRTKFR